MLKPQYDIGFGDAAIDEFLPDEHIRVVHLYPHFAIADIKMKDRELYVPIVLPTDCKKLVVVPFVIGNDLVFRLVAVLRHLRGIFFEQCLDDMLILFYLIYSAISGRIKNGSLVIVQPSASKAARTT